MFWQTPVPVCDCKRPKWTLKFSYLNSVAHIIFVDETCVYWNHSPYATAYRMWALNVYSEVVASILKMKEGVVWAMYDHDVQVMARVACHTCHGLSTARPTAWSSLDGRQWLLNTRPVSSVSTKLNCTIRYISLSSRHR